MDMMNTPFVVPNPEQNGARTMSRSKKAPFSTACYSNQQDHEVLDRKVIKDILIKLAKAKVEASPVSSSRPEHLEVLLRQCGSQLERNFLSYIEAHGHRLPSKAQPFIEACQTRPDFLYENSLAVIYVDGPPHDYPERQARDAVQTVCMEDLGYTVIRLHHADDWAAQIARFPHIFGKLS